ncbi:MAG: three-helix bundle dimerization domain-containing protein [Actinomycetota bacterium]
MSSITPDVAGRAIEIVEHDLLAEFEGMLPSRDLALLASEEVHAFDGAAVNDFIPILAWRRARRRALAIITSPSSR